MQRYFITEKTNELKGETAFHIGKVMRMRPKEQIELCVGGVCFLAEIVSIDKDMVEVQYLKELDSVPNHVKITLIQGLGKQDKQEIVSKYATEFGVSEIIFVPMKRSIVSYDSSSIDKKMDRFLKIAYEASRLSHRDAVPQISYSESLDKLEYRFDHLWVAYENDKDISFLDCVKNIQKGDSVAILVGPEGGIDEKELAFLASKGFQRVGLGKRILQTEIACLYALSVIDAHLESQSN